MASRFTRQAAPFGYADALDLRLPQGARDAAACRQDEGHAFGFVRRPLPPALPESEADRGFRGLGPMGYRRPDARLHDEVCDRLAEDDSVDARGISVAVAEGEVTLSGHVASTGMKRAAGLCAGRCAGARLVRNALRIGEG